jgi:BirA family biotin operon repressor/biotin-[acetyl-CoA-carboxylase] ligase
MSALRAVAAALADAGTVSGAALAERLGVSRTAVWKQVERLRALGVAIHAERAAGYRLGAPLELLERERIVRAMPRAARRLLAALEVVDEIDSTNVELERRAAQGAASGSVLLAERQSAGRGRRGRAWHSPFAANLYLSVLWRFEQGPAALAGLSLAIGVALIRALADLGIEDAALKWPNDVLLERRKLAGVLVEVAGEWSGPCRAIVGVGLNVRMPATRAIEQPWIDLAARLGAGASRNAAAAAVSARVLAALDDYARVGAGPALTAWRDHDALAGRAVVVHDGSARVSGTALGIDAAGCLCVRDAGGTTRRFASGEVSVREGA